MKDRIHKILEKHNIKLSSDLVEDLIDLTAKNNTDLNELQEKYSLLYNNSNLSYQSLDINGNIIDVNNTWLNTLGYKQKDIIGKWFGDFLHPNYISTFKERIEQFKKDASVKDVLFQMRKKNNEYILVSFKSCILHKPNREFKGTYCSFVDITEETELLKKLKESEEKFRAITSSAQDAIILINEKGNIIFWNKAAEKKFQYKENEVLGKNLHTLITPKKYIEKHNSAFSKFIKTGKGNAINKVVEVSALRKDGAEFPIDLSLSALKIHNKWHSVGIIRDITERKKNEIKLKESEERFKELSELTFEGIIIHKNGIAIDCNQSFLNIFGYTSDELIGINLFDIIHPKDHQSVTENISKEKTVPYEITGIKKNGNEIPVEIEARNFKKNNNTFRVAAIRDITERRNNEIELKKLLNLADIKQEELNEINATKDRFFSIIAHDLRGPVNNLVGFSDLLERNHHVYNKDKLAHIINLMNTSAKNTYSLLENLLIWSQSQRNKISFNPQTFICKKLIKEVLDEMQHLARVKGISIVHDGNEGRHVKVDKDMFKTVFRNLISNAIKFTNEGGEIVIGCGKIIDNQIEFFVKDNGVGIPPDNLSKIFRLDHNITTEGTNKEKGTGLGLILCKEFVERHGGKIRVESEIKKGAKFTFTFPLSNK